MTAPEEHMQLAAWLRNPWQKCDDTPRGPIPEWQAALMFEAANVIDGYSRSAVITQAAVAAAYEAAAQAVGWEAYVADTSPQYLSDWQRGLVAGQQAMCKAIRALATPDQIAALAAKVDASQAPNPAVNEGSCQSDTIPLPRAEVEALMEAAQLVSDWDEWALQRIGVARTDW